MSSGNCKSKAGLADRKRLVTELITARRAVAKARRANKTDADADADADAEAEAESHAAVETAKVALGGSGGPTA